MATAGRVLRAKAATASGGPYTVIAELNDASMTQNGNTQDISAFGDDYVKKIQGLKDATYSLSGFWNGADTNGQLAIRNSWLNDTALFVQFLPNGTVGFQQEVKVASLDINAGVDGTVEFSAELEGTGTITVV